MRLRTLSIEQRRPRQTTHAYSKAYGKESHLRRGNEVSEQTGGGEKVEEHIVVNSCGADGANAEEEGRHGGHDEDFPAGDAHVPEGEVPDADAEGGEDAPEDELCGFVSAIDRCELEKPDIRHCTRLLLYR